MCVHTQFNSILINLGALLLLCPFFLCQRSGQKQAASEECMYLTALNFSLVPCTLAPHKWTVSMEDNKNKQPRVKVGDKTTFFHDRTTLI